MNAEIIKAALELYGLKEIEGKENNETIVNFFKEIGHSWVKDDETPWCSCFANIVAKRTGHQFTGKLNAQSWLDVGEKVETPEIGDVVVLWRDKPDSGKGHVGFFIREEKEKGSIHILGGNQSNQVSIWSYPKTRLLGYRRLNKIT